MTFSQTGFEVLSAGVIVLTLLVLAKTWGKARLLWTYSAIALSGLIGEHTCISWYEAYRYAPTWHGRVGHVPILVPLIWPLVVLSARAIAGAMLGVSKIPEGRGTRNKLRVALLGAAIVIFDATLMEVVSVRAGLWSWADPGLLSVPLIGITGWGFFAFGVLWALELESPYRLLWLLIIAPVLTHALLIASYHGFFSHFGGDHTRAFVALYGALAAVSAVTARVLRRSGRAVPREVWLPRIFATLLFVGVFAITLPHPGEVWVVFAAAALPHLASLDFGARPAAPARISEVDVLG